MSKLSEDFKEITLALKETLEDWTKSIATFIIDGWLVLLFLVFVGGVGIALSNPPPPKHVKIAIGTPGFMTYIGDEYKRFFKENGIELEIVETKGLIAVVEISIKIYSFYKFVCYNPFGIRITLINAFSP